MHIPPPSRAGNKGREYLTVSVRGTVSGSRKRLFETKPSSRKRGRDPLANQKKKRLEI